MPLERFKAAWPQLSRPYVRSITFLVVTLATEYALMIFLPWLLPKGASRVLEASLDAVLLTVIVSPILWWTMVRPLQQAARLRDRFLADLFATIEDERRRIAHELHDGVGQTLTMLVGGLRSLKPAIGTEELQRRGQELQALAQRALLDTKQMARGLRLSLLDDLGLAVAVERVAGEVAANHQLNVKVDVQELSGIRLAERVETALFRIFQEAVANVVQHSGASEVSITLQRLPHHVVLVIADNGRGMHVLPGLQGRPVGHFGLIGMQERAALLGGELTIASEVGRGTTIRATIPV